MEIRLIRTMSNNKNNKNYYWRILPTEMTKLGVYDGKKYEVSLKGFKDEWIATDVDELIINLDKCSYTFTEGKPKINIELIDKDAKAEYYEKHEADLDEYDDLFRVHLIEEFKKDIDGNIVLQKNYYAYTTKGMFLDEKDLLSEEVFNKILENSSDLGSLGNRMLNKQHRFQIRDNYILNLCRDINAESVILKNNHKYSFIVGYDNKIWIEMK